MCETHLHYYFNLHVRLYFRRRRRRRRGRRRRRRRGRRRRPTVVEIGLKNVHDYFPKKF